MFKREALKELNKWKKSPNRKPLVLRGARQVGKTSLVNMFSEEFENYIYLNLENKKELELFDKELPIDELLNTIFFIKKKRKKAGTILIFIDEIQNSPKAVALLRYFYEETPEIFIIAAGSLLETLMDKKINFPVGRVEYLKLQACSFVEFLGACGETLSLELVQKDKFPEYGHDKLMSLFHKYTLIGGMPEVVQNYSQNKDVLALNKIYRSLIISYLDDSEKYARNDAMSKVISHTIEKAFANAGQRIKFQHFGNSNYRSREVGEAFRTLEKAMLLQLVYPANNTELPINANLRKSPRLQVLDTGLLNYSAGIQEEIFGSKELDSVYEGTVSEHIVGQELLTLDYSPLNKLTFWTRENKNSNSEIDYIYRYKGKVFPIEVKRGKSGRLRSLHEFIDRAKHNYAIRVYSGKLSIDKVKTIKGKEYFLLNLPFYLLSRLEHYIEQLISSN